MDEFGDEDEGTLSAVTRTCDSLTLLRAEILLAALAQAEAQAKQRASLQQVTGVVEGLKATATPKCRFCAAPAGAPCACNRQAAVQPAMQPPPPAWPAAAPPARPPPAAAPRAAAPPQAPRAVAPPHAPRATAPLAAPQRGLFSFFAPVEAPPEEPLPPPEVDADGLAECSLASAGMRVDPVAAQTYHFPAQTEQRAYQASIVRVRCVRHGFPFAPAPHSPFRPVSFRTRWCACPRGWGRR